LDPAVLGTRISRSDLPITFHLGLAGPAQEAPATAAMSGIENTDEIRMGNHDLRPEIN
jgi:hypothetical protein